MNTKYNVGDKVWIITKKNNGLYDTLPTLFTLKDKQYWEWATPQLVTIDKIIITKHGIKYVTNQTYYKINSKYDREGTKIDYNITFLNSHISQTEEQALAYIKAIRFWDCNCHTKCCCHCENCCKCCNK
jgi:hypothetical protein